jgi:TRAP-type C4-dicarboxylate transport system permease small subunit
MRFFDAIVGGAARAAGVLLLAATAIVLVEVVSRYFFHRPILGSVEITEYCLLWMTFLAVAWVQRRDAHVRVDFVLRLLAPRAQHALNAATSFAAAIALLVVAAIGLEVVWFRYSTDYLLSTPLRPSGALILAVVPFGCLLLGVEFLRQGVSHARAFRDRPAGQP